jgi:uncharacterized membrane protein
MAEWHDSHKHEVLEQFSALKRGQDRIVFLPIRTDYIFTFVWISMCYTLWKRSYQFLLLVDHILA